jgi:hypothetical protein
MVNSFLLPKMFIPPFLTIKLGLNSSFFGLIINHFVKLLYHPVNFIKDENNWDCFLKTIQFLFRKKTKILDFKQIYLYAVHKKKEGNTNF